jgi:hypothetical protein
VVNLFDEDVPPSVTRFFGHVCGVIAAAMAALSGFGIWRLVGGFVAGRASVSGVVLVLIGIAITGLLFRWAGVLTGYWPTRGGLAVPAIVYAALAVLFAAAALMGVYLLVLPGSFSLGRPIPFAIGTLCAGALAHWCRVLALKQWRQNPPG